MCHVLCCGSVVSYTTCPVKPSLSGICDCLSSLIFLNCLIVYLFLVYLNPVSLSFWTRYFCLPNVHSSVNLSRVPLLLLHKYFFCTLNCTFANYLDLHVSTHFCIKTILIRTFCESLHLSNPLKPVPDNLFVYVCPAMLLV